jgi:hypothetical protein
LLLSVAVFAGLSGWPDLLQLNGKDLRNLPVETKGEAGSAAQKAAGSHPVPRHGFSWKRGRFSGVLFRGNWRVGYGLI